MVDKQTIDLGFILRKFPEFKFSMEEFDDRLRLQKFIYLMQAFNIYLGYDFSWYLRGPYCTRLATCGFALEDEIYARIPERNPTSRFASETVQRRFEMFKEYIHGKEMNAEFLETAASLHYLIKAVGLDQDEALSIVSKKVPDMDIKECRMVLDGMRGPGLI